MKNIGLFGGSFDPVHEGHVHIAEVFVSQYNLDTCIFIPTNISPFKIQNKDTMYSQIERFELLKKTIEKYKNFSISDYEIKSGGTSYTINTIKYFHELYSSANLFFLIGTDQAVNFNKWKNYEKILELATIVIAKREPLPTQKEIIHLNNIFNNKINWLNNQIMPISSTEIRASRKIF